jgi:hypothetical protein
MNERIKQLAEQAGYEKDMFGIGHWDMPECKKFAELIVQECMEVVAGKCASPTAYNALAEHFGVEE